MLLLSENKMFREQNYENVFALNILYLNISDICISGFGRNSDSNMRTFWIFDVEKFEIQTGDIQTLPNMASVMQKIGDSCHSGCRLV